MSSLSTTSRSQPASRGATADAAPSVIGRLRAHTDRQPLLMDAVATLTLDALTAIPLMYGENRWWVWLLDQALVLPLMTRRKYPLATFGVIVAMAFLQWLADVPLAADAALLIGLYTIAEHQDRARSLLAAGVLEVGVVLASVRFAPAGESLVSSLVFLTGMVIAALFVGTALRTRRAYIASVEDRAQQLEVERDQRELIAATRERNRIAREMHDIVAHSLSVIIALADGASLTNEHDEKAATDAMLNVSATGRQAMAEMRRLLGILRETDQSPSGRAPQPGLARLPELVERMAQVGPPIEVTVTGPPRPLAPTLDATAYRIVQESLTNVVKHAAGATRVDLELAWTAEHLQVTVHNDGVGSVAGDDPGSGHGLTGMAERAALFDGAVVAGPTGDGGWRVRARLPLRVGT